MNKGFIGAIGDDLPSLIPIVISLLLFFSIFTLTLDSYNDKNMELRKKIGLMSVSRTIKGQSLILGVDYFEENCEKSKLKKHPYNFMVAIYPANELDDVLEDFYESDVGNPYVDADFLAQNDEDGFEEQFFCGYRRIGSSKFSSSRTNYILRYYPVAVQRHVVYKGNEHVLVLPAVMAMVVWE